MHQKMEEALGVLDHAAFPQVAEIRHYIEHGDAESLAKIKKVGQSDEGWVGYLSAAIADLSNWSEEDRRAIHVLAALESAVSLGHNWLPQALLRESADEDCCAALRAELHTQHVSDSVITSAIVLAGAKTGQPNSANRFILSLSDKDLVQAIKTAPENIDLPGLFSLLAVEAQTVFHAC